MTRVRPIFVATLIGVIGGWLVGTYVSLYAFYLIVMVVTNGRRSM